MEPADTYRRFAEYYDAYVQGFAPDIPLYLSCCAGMRRIVEIGCGTGRVLEPLLQARHQIVGVDISAEMLDIAAEKLHPYVGSGTLRLVNHNFVDAPMEEQFDCALVTFFTFNYILDEADQRLFLRHAAQSLEPGAVFAADLFYPHPLAHPEEAGVWREISLQVDGEPVLMRDRRHMEASIERREQVFVAGRGKETVITLRRFVPKQEIDHLLQQTGFHNVRFIDGYDAKGAHAPRPGEETICPYCVLAEKS